MVQLTVWAGGWYDRARFPLWILQLLKLDYPQNNAEVYFKICFKIIQDISLKPQEMASYVEHNNVLWAEGRSEDLKQFWKQIKRVLLYSIVFFWRSCDGCWKGARAVEDDSQDLSPKHWIIWQTGRVNGGMGRNTRCRIRSENTQLLFHTKRTARGWHHSHGTQEALRRIHALPSSWLVGLPQARFTRVSGTRAGGGYFHKTGTLLCLFPPPPTKGHTTLSWLLCCEK